MEVRECGGGDIRFIWHTLQHLWIYQIVERGWVRVYSVKSQLSQDLETSGS